MPHVTYLSLPYVYPLCPLNFNHAKMFVVADIFARFARAMSPEDTTVLFPVASHFTGNTAHATADAIARYLAGEKNQETIAAYNLYRNFYGTPANTVQLFTDPDYLMGYFHEEILWELKTLQVSCDYKNAYTTQSEAFACFVRTVIRRYDEEGLLVYNQNQELAINYDDPQWREDTVNLINSTQIQKNFQRKNILSAFHNLSSGWELLRNSGYGVAYDNSGWIIDPMFDSELFMLYDLFNYWTRHYRVEISDHNRFFDFLFLSLKENCNKMPEDFGEERTVLQGILDSLPCNIFFGEEHLKNWLCKKFFAEQRLIHPDLRTASYRILGMGLLDGRRMSASAGHSILARDLIHAHGGQIARMTILLSGGNVSKGYQYERSLPDMAKKMLRDFSNYWIFLNTGCGNGRDRCDTGTYAAEIESYIQDGYLRKALTELLVNIPSKNKCPDEQSRQQLLSFYQTYLPIFLPEFDLCQMQ